mmetsp:Transcript_29013/g.68171  ORF Transcript_29013/g.68171 Transcript_29013/m.68171 type:complete len:292 (-) Transcript_29013:250-1125(-)
MDLRTAECRLVGRCLCFLFGYLVPRNLELGSRLGLFPRHCKVLLDLGGGPRCQSLHIVHQRQQFFLRNACFQQRTGVRCKRLGLRLAKASTQIRLRQRQLVERRPRGWQADLVVACFRERVQRWLPRLPKGLELIGVHGVHCDGCESVHDAHGREGNQRARIRAEVRKRALEDGVERFELFDRSRVQDVDPEVDGFSQFGRIDLEQQLADLDTECLEIDGIELSQDGIGRLAELDNGLVECRHGCVRRGNGWDRHGCHHQRCGQRRGAQSVVQHIFVCQSRGTVCGILPGF